MSKLWPKQGPSRFAIKRVPFSMTMEKNGSLIRAFAQTNCAREQQERNETGQAESEYDKK